jgi:hypothetical protein
MNGNKDRKQDPSLRFATLGMTPFALAPLGMTTSGDSSPNARNDNGVDRTLNALGQRASYEQRTPRRRARILALGDMMRNLGIAAIAAALMAGAAPVARAQNVHTSPARALHPNVQRREFRDRLEDRRDRREDVRDRREKRPRSTRKT